jgi:hypothetical protein
VRERFAATTGGDRPSISTVLVRLRPDHYVWLLVQHQLVSDAWSFRLIHERLSRHYERELGRSLDVTAGLPQFRDYLDYERRYRASAAGRAARAYWERRCTGPSGRQAAAEPRLGHDGTQVERMSCRLNTTSSAAVRRLALAESASLDTGLFCVFASLVVAHLQRLDGKRDVTLSVPFSNRPGERFKNTIGSFMTVCPVRVTAERGDTFLDLYRRVHAEMWEAARHQGYAVRQMPVDQSYDVLVNVHKKRVAVRGFAGLSTDVEWVAPTHRFGALALAVQDFNAAGILTLAFDFNIAAFTATAREETMRELLHLLDACLTDPTQRPADVAAASATRALVGTSAVAAHDAERDGSVERAVAAIWCELLEVDKVDPADDFFELGGDSLLVHRMLSRVRATLRVAPAPVTFFENPTLSSIAAAIAIAVQAVEALSEEQASAMLDDQPSAGTDESRPNHG